MWFLFQRCQEGTWLKDTRYSLQSFPLAWRSVSIAPVPSSFSLCHRYCTFRSPDYNNRIRSCFTHWEEWVKVSFRADSDWLGLPEETRRGIVARLLRDTHRADTSLFLPSSFSLLETLRVVSFTLLFIFIIILYYLLCYFIRYIVTRYRLLSLLLRLL